MRQAFSLIELAIVLVILGLLTGGILAGQSLIRAAELRSISTDLNRFQTSIYTFRDKYFAYPGDMTNATAFWGDDNAVCPDGAVANGNPGTCNGNGDGILNLSGDGVRAWQHLAMAGLIEGTYAGVTGTQATHIGTSVPRARLAGVGYEMEYYSKASCGWTGADTTQPYNEIRFGTIYTGADPPMRVSNPAFKPEEVWNMDTKIDDGKPGSGKLYVYGGPCSTGSDVATAQYALSDTSPVCLPQLIILR